MIRRLYSDIKKNDSVVGLKFEALDNEAKNRAISLHRQRIEEISCLDGGDSYKKHARVLFM